MKGFEHWTDADVDRHQRKTAKSLTGRLPAARFATQQPRHELLMRGSPVITLDDARRALGGLRIVVLGQVMGGKNNIIITRTGKRIPQASWAKWRDEAVRAVKQQIQPGFKTITEPVNVSLEYVAGDRRRRDMPAIVDALWHVLEKAGVVADDTLLWCSQSTRAYDKASPRAVIEIL